MAKKKAAPKRVQSKSKADFVRSLPSSMSAKDVVAKAKAAKISLTEDYVYKTRSLDNKRGNRKQKIVTSASDRAMPSGAKTPRKGSNKRSRVLEVAASNPSWNAKEVAKEARASVAYVYSVWRKPESRSSASAEPAGSATITEFYRVLKRIGVHQARELITHFEAMQNA